MVSLIYINVLSQIPKAGITAFTTHWHLLLLATLKKMELLIIDCYWIDYPIFPFELNIKSAHERKTEKYSSQIGDLKDNNIFTKFIALEIGSRGYIDEDNAKRLKEILKISKDEPAWVNELDLLNCWNVLISVTLPIYSDFRKETARDLGCGT